MAKLAIRGHATRGKEVIEILEMLGGNNKYHINITECSLLYTIREGDDAIIATYPSSNISQIFTLDEFLEQFPYKVGDKVTLDKFPCTIKGMSWDCDDVIYYVQGVDFLKGAYSKDKDLQPYKEETMEEIKVDIPKGYEFAGVDDDNQQVVFTKIGYHYLLENSRRADGIG